MVGISRHHLGELEAARSYLTRSLAQDTLEARQAMMTQFGYDRRTPTLAVLGNLHWVEGQPDRAIDLGANAITEARRLPYPVPLCEALTWQALNMHLRGDDPVQIDALLDEAIAHARRHFIESYVGLGMALKGLNAAVDSAMVSEGLALLSKSNYEVFHPLFRTECFRLRAQDGVPLSDEEFDALLAPGLNDVESWNSAEVKRNLGEILLMRGEKQRASQLFADAAERAEKQGALGWALRVALSRARSAPDELSRRQAADGLEWLIQKFTEGEGTADVKAARRYLSKT